MSSFANRCSSSSESTRDLKLTRDEHPQRREMKIPHILNDYDDSDSDSDGSKPAMDTLKPAASSHVSLLSLAPNLQQLSPSVHSAVKSTAEQKDRHAESQRKNRVDEDAFWRMQELSLMKLGWGLRESKQQNRKWQRQMQKKRILIGSLQATWLLFILLQHLEIHGDITKIIQIAIDDFEATAEKSQLADRKFRFGSETPTGPLSPIWHWPEISFYSVLSEDGDAKWKRLIEETLAADSESPSRKGRRGA